MIKNIKIYIAIGLFSLFSPILTIANEIHEELKIVRVTPAGEDSEVGRQIVIEFNQPVVPLGKMDRKKEEIPIKISPQIDCEWRWLNTSTLACNLRENEELKPSTKYTLVINPGIKTENGLTTDQPFQHEFITLRADITNAWHKTWESPVQPVIRITLNQPVTKDSIEKHLFFTSIEKNNSVSTKVKALPDPDIQEKPYIFTADGKLIFGFTTNEEVKSDEQTTIKKGFEARRVWLIKPVKKLKPNSKIILKLDQGLVSALGLEKSVVKREILEFDTFPEFKFIGVKCYTNNGESILVTKKSPQPASKLCNPLAPISLAFNAPVMRSEVKKNFSFKPSLSGNNKNYDPWGTFDYEYSRLNSPYIKGTIYEVWLPGGLKAAHKYTIKLKAKKLSFYQKIKYKVLSYFKIYPLTNLKDEFGRKLAKPIKIQIKTDHRKPNFEMPYRNAVLEKSIDSEVPIYVNNLSKYKLSFRSITSVGSKNNQSYEQEVPYVQDVQFAVPLGVRKMLNNKSGAIFGVLDTEPNIGKSYWESKLFAQVTPYNIHIKLGHFNTLALVTDLATGKAVSSAKITAYKDSLVNLSAPQDILATAETNHDGIAILPGTESMDPDLSHTNAWDDKDKTIFFRVDKGENIAILPALYEYKIDTWRTSAENIYSYHKRKYAHMLAWGTTAQGIYRAGDTIQYKIYIRNQDSNTLTLPPLSGYKLEVIDPTGKITHEVKDIILSKFGSYSGEFSIPKQAVTGWYDFQLKLNLNQQVNPTESKDNSINILYPLRVLVSDFTPSPFKVVNELNGDLFKGEQEVNITTLASLHSGGAYTDASTRITAILESKGYTSSHPQVQNFYFTTTSNQDVKHQIYQKVDKLNEKGELNNQFIIPKQSIIYGKLLIESAVQDDRGKNITALSTADYFGVDRLVGLKATKWLYEKGKTETFEYIVVDEQGKPAPDTKVNIVIEREITNAARVKSAGNAYITNFTTNWERESNCQGISKGEALSCKFTPSQAGTYRITASILDSKGNPHSTEIKVWVVGDGYVLWDDNSDFYLPIIPEKLNYKVGEDAKFLIKNPYPGANALITVERYGVIDHFIQKLEGSTPVITVPVKADYLPGFYLSVTILSPRVEKPKKDWQIDLGKPTFKMGYATISVQDKYKEMVVTASTDKGIYKPREKVKLKLHAEPRFKNESNEPIEFAVAVIDESVLDLIPGGKSYYDPYIGLYKLDNLDLTNYSLLTTLLGRQKFEKKGANQGGDGGSDFALRNIFKFVSYWNPSLEADENGNTSIEFEVPDNLTGWRVIAIAVDSKDRMGLGDVNFKVNRPTEVRAVMPNQVVEKDNFVAGFNIMNRTDKKRILDVNIKVSGDISDPKRISESNQTVELEPYKFKIVWVPVKTNALRQDKEYGEISFTAKAWDKSDGDALSHTLRLNKMRSLETVANYGTSTSTQIEESINIPRNINEDIGDIKVTIAPSVINNLEGAFKYIKDYPYTCWEQVLTKGVMGAHYQNLKNYLAKDFTWEGSEKIAQETISLATNFQAENGGMAYFIPENAYVDPYLTAYTAIAFNWLEANGYQIPNLVEEKLHSYLLNMLRMDIFPDFYNESMSSTVRAVALAALAEKGKITTSDIDRYLMHTKNMSLFGKAYFLKAVLKVKGVKQEAISLKEQILSHATESAGKLIFNEELDDSYSRILSSNLRDNCTILDAFIDIKNIGELEHSGINDNLFKIVRYITQSRKNRDYWENTQENMFCMNALINYSKLYEGEHPRYKVKTSFNSENLGEQEFKGVQDQPVSFIKNINKKDIGSKGKIKIQKEGNGRIYYTTTLSFSAIDQLKQAVNSGIEIKREYSINKDNKWSLLSNPLEIKRGDLVRVDIYLSLPTARNFVVVNDPVPGGLEPVNRDLATASIVDINNNEFLAAGGSWWFKFNDWKEYHASRWSFYHQELKHDVVRFYSDYLPAGNYHLSYVAQAIAEGNFTIMPSLVHEMYDPEVYGKEVALKLRVKN